MKSSLFFSKDIKEEMLNQLEMILFSSQSLLAGSIYPRVCTQDHTSTTTYEQVASKRSEPYDSLKGF